MKASNVLRSFLVATVLWLAVPYVVGFLAYGATFGGVVEQMWLDRAIAHLKVLRGRCHDPDLQGVLDYTIQRYNRIGPFDVAVSRCVSLDPRCRVIGVNNPFCPGVTLDMEVLTYPIHDGAMVLVHEALHDYWPYFGHKHVTPREKALHQLFAGTPHGCHE